MLQLVYFPNILSDVHKETLFCIYYVSLLYVRHSTCNLYTDAVWERLPPLRINAKQSCNLTQRKYFYLVPYIAGNYMPRSHLLCHFKNIFQKLLTSLSLEDENPDKSPPFPILGIFPNTYC